jgi:hypothetical protein
MSITIVVGGGSGIGQAVAIRVPARGSGVIVTDNKNPPGPTRTRIADDAFEKYPEVIPPIVARNALGRPGEADDVGAVLA